MITRPSGLVPALVACALLVLTAVPAVPAAAAAAVPATARAKAPHVLVIGIDGLVWDRVAEADAPTLDRLAAEGTLGQSLVYAQPMAATSSGPGWSTLLTGTWPDQHGVVDNTFDGSRIERHPDLLTRVERADPSLDTWAGVDWKAIDDFILTGEIDTTIALDGDEDGYVAYDRRLTREGAEHLTDDPADVTFVYLGQTDIVGHAEGSASPDYRDQIEVVDGQVATLLAAVAARPSRDDEDWLVLLGTDHGHLAGGGHGGSSLIERGTFVLAWGDGVSPASPSTTRLTDLAATALDHLGVPAARDLAGRPITTPERDPFESVRDDLRPAVTEDVPAAVLGWTHRLPDGWRQDRTAMPAGGVREWRGWTMTTDAFWSSAAPDQERETFVRGRGVIAVADPDEWADADSAEGERFDATLWTSRERVRGAGSVTLTMTHRYRQEGDALGQVLVRIDGAEPSVVDILDADSDGGRERWVVALPDSARTVSFGLRHAGTNTWYWAVDDLRIRGAR